jgi:hypothetical protein
VREERETSNMEVSSAVFRVPLAADCHVYVTKFCLVKMEKSEWWSCSFLASSVCMIGVCLVDFKRIAMAVFGLFWSVHCGVFREADWFVVPQLMQ